MTEQLPHDLLIEDPEVSFGDWSLYGLVRGRPSKENHGWGETTKVYATNPGHPPSVMSSCWAGFTEVYRLTREGQLVLVRFTYWTEPTWDGGLRGDVNEELQGDFFAVFKSEFSGPRLYVPFRAGHMVRDRDQWLHEAYVGDGVDAEYMSGCQPDFPRSARSPYGRPLPEPSGEVATAKFGMGRSFVPIVLALAIGWFFLRHC